MIISYIILYICIMYIFIQIFIMNEKNMMFQSKDKKKTAKMCMLIVIEKR